MSTLKLQNYVRTFRKRSGLSQQELAFLFGCHSGNKVSRYERFTRAPTLQTAFVFELVFRVPARTLFAGTFFEVRRRTIRQARVLLHRLQSASPEDALANKKLAALRSIVTLSVDDPPFQT